MTIFCLLHFNRKMKIKKGNTQIEFKYILFYTSKWMICLTWRMCRFQNGNLIWSEDVFKGNLMFQFSWLEEFCHGKVSGWWTLDEFQYKNGLNDQLLTCTHISNRMLDKDMSMCFVTTSHSFFIAIIFKNIWKEHNRGHDFVCLLVGYLSAHINYYKLQFCWCRSS